MAKRKKVKRRTGNIQAYSMRYPKMSQAKIARVFKVSQATVSRALREFDSVGGL